MKFVIFAAAAAIGVFASFTASAQVADPNMKCSEYLKVAQPTPKTGDATMDSQMADLDKKSERLLQSASGSNRDGSCYKSNGRLKR